MTCVRITFLLAVWTSLPLLLPAADNPNAVPFRLYRGYVIVARGSIGDLENLNFLLDTGAVPTVVDTRVARRLRLKGQAEPLSVFTRQLESQRATAPDVRLGPLHTQQLPVLIQDLSLVEESLGMHVDAMVGFDFLGQAPFTIDYKTKEILFGPIDPSLAAIPYRPGLPYAVVDLQIQGHKLAIVVDTGASDLVLFEGAVRDLHAAIVPTRSLAWSNLGGEVRVREARLKDSYFGAVSWEDRAAFLLEDDNQRPAGLAGLLGTVALKSRRVGFGPQRKVVAWEQKEERVRAANVP